MQQQFIISPQADQLVSEFGTHGFSNGLQHSVEIVDGAHGWDSNTYRRPMYREIDSPTTKISAFGQRHFR